MANETTRRDMLKKTGLAAAGLGVLGVPEWALPVMAQGETLVPFTDWPANFNPNPAPDRRLFNTQTISGVMTPKDEFFTTQHYGHPVVDPAAYRLKVSGLVDKPAAFSLDVGGFVSNLTAATLGNIIGGGLLVGLVYWFVYLRPAKEARAA